MNYFQLTEPMTLQVIREGKDAANRCVLDQRVDLIMDIIFQIIHTWETCAAIKQAKGVKSLQYGE